MSPESLMRLAMRSLHGVGSRERGEWHDWTGKAYHVRRRLSAKEQLQVGEVLDVRGTAEAMERFAAIKSVLPQRAAEMALEEIAGMGDASRESVSRHGNVRYAKS